MEIFNDKAKMFTFNDWQKDKVDIALSLPESLEDGNPTVFRILADRNDKAFVEGIEKQFNTYYAMLHDGANSYQLSHMQRLIVNYSEDLGYNVKTMKSKEYERLSEIKLWRGDGLQPCNAIDIGNKEVIALCGVEQSSKHMQDYIKEEQTKLNATYKELLDQKRYPSDVWNSKEWKATVDALEYNLHLSTFSNIMRMSSKEYQREATDIYQAKHHLSMEKEMKKVKQWGLEYGDSYVLWVQDLHARRSNPIAIKESMIKGASSLETAAMWYAYGKQLVEENKDKDTLHKVDLDNKNEYLVRITEKTANRKLDSCFNKKWEKILNKVLEERNMTREDYFKNQEYMNDLKIGYLHKAPSLRSKVAKIEELQNER